jgi:translation initiation factor 1
MSKKNKNLVNVVYSTNPNFQYQQEEQVEHGTLPNQQQKLYVSIDKNSTLNSIGGATNTFTGGGDINSKRCAG